MTHAEYANGLRQIARLLAPCDKRTDNNLFYLSRRFGALTLQFIRGQEAVCTARVVGTRVIPAQPAEPEREVEVVEWDCGPILQEEAIP